MGKDEKQCPECQEYFETINLGEICSSCASKNTSHVLPKSKTLSRMAYLRKILVEAAFVLLAHILLSLINVKIEPYVLNSFNPVSGQAVQAIRSTSLLLVIAIPTILLMIRFMLVFLGATASRIRDVGYSGVYASLILMPLLPVVIGFLLPTVAGGSSNIELIKIALDLVNIFSFSCFLIALSICFFAPANFSKHLTSCISEGNPTRAISGS